MIIKPYVDAVATFLVNKDTIPPITLSLEGEWGSGKSSFMRQLQEAIKKESTLQKAKDPIYVKFNAWQHDKDDAMWAAFAVAFMQEIKKELSFVERQLARLRLIFKQLEWRSMVKDVIRYFAPASIIVVLIAVIAALLALIAQKYPVLADYAREISVNKKIKDMLGVFGYSSVGSAFLVFSYIIFKKLPEKMWSIPFLDMSRYVRNMDYNAKVAFLPKFHEGFRVIINALVPDTERRIFVFVDDLDRCDVPKAADLMQAISMMIPKDPRLIFILGMDSEKVAAGLAVKHQSLLQYYADGNDDNGLKESGMKYGKEFLEKFIQVTFTLPKPSQDYLDKYIDSLFIPETEKNRKNKDKSKFNSMYEIFMYILKFDLNPWLPKWLKKPKGYLDDDEVEIA